MTFSPGSSPRGDSRLVRCYSRCRSRLILMASTKSQFIANNSVFGPHGLGKTWRNKQPHEGRRRKLLETLTTYRRSAYRKPRLLSLPSGRIVGAASLALSIDFLPLGPTSAHFKRHISHSKSEIQSKFKISRYFSDFLWPKDTIL